ncbi:hypothetical protein HS088_TW04G00130 [Tripterygium wilfordii]|uniref:Histone acetyltransferase n=1 Tax=Tripterygium wilfordii TaxID=458696 RepID=A0A7J7DP73_TRIWF|nr:uncharacterized protein LOC119996083 [Tripterygium wilfordii]KAF5748180.1 hypothetical protein HS088_TW04G00130 [Tripterygium wilfordii]
MPRPGPRPYECVRRAWHSDRHKTIRGSLIQEIFRVVDEIHSAATKKNKEWQEKLPIVVLKVEEIMYSKANSETEYMDFKTLWDRANDAINTIIRLDESTETGQFLQPCIEAALSLGCVARRTSRSQRNNNLRCYLGVNTQEPPCFSPTMLVKSTQGNHAANSQCMPSSTHFPKQMVFNSVNPSSNSHNLVAQRNTCTVNKIPFVHNLVSPVGNNQCLPMETYPRSNLYSVYPLYYGNHFQLEESQPGSEILAKLISSSMEPAKMDATKNQFSCNMDDSINISRTDIRCIPAKPREVGCDLSLRLGPFFTPSGAASKQSPEVAYVGHGYSQERVNYNDLTPQMRKELPFYTKGNLDVPKDLFSANWSFEGEFVDQEAAIRKGKAVFLQPEEDQQFCWQPRHPFPR